MRLFVVVEEGVELPRPNGSVFFAGKAGAKVVLFFDICKFWREYLEKKIPKSPTLWERGNEGKVVAKMRQR